MLSLSSRLNTEEQSRDVLDCWQCHSQSWKTPKLGCLRSGCLTGTCSMTEESVAVTQVMNTVCHGGAGAGLWCEEWPGSHSSEQCDTENNPGRIYKRPWSTSYVEDPIWSTAAVRTNGLNPCPELLFWQNWQKINKIDWPKWR